MATERNSSESPWQKLYGPNLGYVQEQYDLYLTDPSMVDPELQDAFNQWGAPPLAETPEQAQVPSGNIPGIDIEKMIAAVKLADKIRAYGHLAANIYPLNGHEADTRLLSPEAYGLSDADLRALPAKLVWKNAPESARNGLEAINALRETYTKTLTFEFSHVHEAEERQWLNNMVESGAIYPPLPNERRVALLHRLTEVECFERFLHKTFVGQKRFSIEGVDALVPMLDVIIRDAVRDGAKNVMIGMAHRGRLNVLAHVLGKPYKNIISEFHHTPIDNMTPVDGWTGVGRGWSGDVKYHLGGGYEIKENNTVRARLTLANNPSHLEFVDPVVEGYARAAQEDRTEAGFPKQDESKAFAILIHGDAAFPGEGIVSETLNLSRLRGYHTGGTVHIITNNLLGFTTESVDDRSTRYASDLAKGFEIPIVHVNADDPEACLAAVHLAYEYRRRFNKDFLIDLVGYRRFGHNEMDDPAVTQPLLYEKVANHPTVRALYAEALEQEGVVSKADAEKMENEIYDKLQSIYDDIRRAGKGHVEEEQLPSAVANDLPVFDTAVDGKTLNKINANLLQWPEGFKVYRKLEKILMRRANALGEGGKVDWGHAETLAFATILSDGVPIRITGQDTERGTFSHRHLMLHDEQTGACYSPLHVLPEAKASFAIHNSPLSEGSVLGFEYGYNVYAPETLVLWEAQYGDFANTAQVIFDQFISAARAKWGQKSGLVMLLPHGYEGQGPEHSSARLERYLQLAAENNWTVANLSSAAQYFHILRRQATLLGQESVRPLVIVTPKSLLRNPMVASEAAAFTDGRFETVLDAPGQSANPDNVTRLVLASGKVAIDLSAAFNDDDAPSDLHILRVEQLYPFPKKEIKAVISRFKNLKEIVWVQEEPKNMGAWMYIEPRLRMVQPKGVTLGYIGRPDRSSPATGEPDVHKMEQEWIINEALRLKERVSN
ncbi:2-oxoglutarate dehydrogenase E1 component [Camelliibacillus cellulosilyticus]|uniref:2-oxoglutarate dehydrogenase E1 component n=1 Tax=Camelliibacillus cellulosilyticus TaxID=2174486 RepID=A0ABV9GMH4_9BACL